MQSAIWYIATGILLTAAGLAGVALGGRMLRRILALNIGGSGVFLLLVAPAQRAAEHSPDPVPQAMVLTGIVVAVSATALALALAGRVGSVRRRESDRSV